MTEIKERNDFTKFVASKKTISALEGIVLSKDAKLDHEYVEDGYEVRWYKLQGDVATYNLEFRFHTVKDEASYGLDRNALIAILNQAQVNNLKELFRKAGIKADHIKDLL